MAGPRFVIAGGLRVDYLITREGEARNRMPGGNALYAAAGASYWTEGIALWARYGSSYPQRWLQELAALNLQTAGLIEIRGAHDHRTFYAYAPDGRREDTDPLRHYTRFGLTLPDELADYVDSTPQQDDPHQYEPLAPRPEDWPDLFGEVTAVHLSPLPLATHLSVPIALRTRGIAQITVDPGERYMIPQRAPYLRQILPQTDAFLPSDQEVESLLGEGTDLSEAARTLRSWGATTVVIKMGHQGVLILSPGDDKPLRLRPYHEPGDKRVIDVTGAGDAFCGGFMVGFSLSQNVILAAQMGLVSASLVVENIGALDALQVDQQLAFRRLSYIKRRAEGVEA